MNILDVTQPLTLLLLVGAAVLLIFLGKEIKKTNTNSNRINILFRFSNNAYSTIHDNTRIKL